MERAQPPRVEFSYTQELEKGMSLTIVRIIFPVFSLMISLILVAAIAGSTIETESMDQGAIRGAIVEQLGIEDLPEHLTQEAAVSLSESLLQRVLTSHFPALGTTQLQVLVLGTQVLPQGENPSSVYVTGNVDLHTTQPSSPPLPLPLNFTGGIASFRPLGDGSETERILLDPTFNGWLADPKTWNLVSLLFHTPTLGQITVAEGNPLTLSPGTYTVQLTREPKNDSDVTGFENNAIMLLTSGNNSVRLSLKLEFLITNQTTGESYTVIISQSGILSPQNQTTFTTITDLNPSETAMIVSPTNIMQVSSYTDPEMIGEALNLLLGGEQ